MHASGMYSRHDKTDIVDVAQQVSRCAVSRPLAGVPVIASAVGFNLVENVVTCGTSIVSCDVLLFRRAVPARTVPVYQSYHERS
jgi:hypothetical protein